MGKHSSMAPLSSGDDICMHLLDNVLHRIYRKELQGPLEWIY
jgi:hypothetical protein